jgi:hypothetical protein
MAWGEAILVFIARGKVGWAGKILIIMEPKLTMASLMQDSL